MRDDIMFEVSVLWIPPEIRSIKMLKDLEANATRVKLLDVWLFEGDWETWLENSEEILCVGTLVVSSLGGLSDQELMDLVLKGLKWEGLKEVLDETKN